NPWRFIEINRAVSMAMLSKSENPSAKYVAINDYCNNPADAWAIIVENKISIMIDDTCTEWSTALVQDYCDHSAFSHSTLHANPLRSAMITYLMMQEAK
ncbi:phage protein NinX family protein, partial [Franconibacter helveticus]|uniref:phage protein NinX family protein n=2 Tax=Franconibacter helveticus TaxID=357240 RepID=UPI000465D3E8